MIRPLRSPSPLSVALVLAGFLFALGSGLVHPLALASQHSDQACHEHPEGHVDPAAPTHEEHGHACAFCHLAQALSQTTPPAPPQAWQPRPQALAVAPRLATRCASQAALTPFAPRAPPAI